LATNTVGCSSHLAATTTIIATIDGLGGEDSSYPSLSVAPVAGEDLVLVKHCLQRQVVFAADSLCAAMLHKFIADYRLYISPAFILLFTAVYCFHASYFIGVYCSPLPSGLVVQIYTRQISLSIHCQLLVFIGIAFCCYCLVLLLPCVAIAFCCYCRLWLLPSVAIAFS
jgi:hypothetical protein